MLATDAGWPSAATLTNRYAGKWVRVVQADGSWNIETFALRFEAQGDQLWCIHGDAYGAYGSREPVHADSRIVEPDDSDYEFEWEPS